ncbi:WI12 domain-containing protein, partial [Cephalotus follicularis]
SPALDLESRNSNIVKALYKALTAHGDTEAIARLLASHLEWHYHGPPDCQYMMRKLTGQSRDMEIRFKPRTIMAVGDQRVIVEGWNGPKAYWVHVWTLKDGIITQLREYFNTWLAVIVVVPEDQNAILLWQSEPRKSLNCSLPNLVLAI